MGYLVIISKIIKKNTSTRTNPTGVMKPMKPDLFELYIDTMVMDNAEAEVRQGVEPTPAKAGAEGFSAAPDDMERFVVDAVFRGEASTATTGMRTPPQFVWG